MPQSSFPIVETDVVIVGAGPVGLFSVFELGLVGLNAHLVDTLDRPGGQCAELYPEKPIYDIPGLPMVSGQELTDNLMKQAAPFSPTFHLDQRVDRLLQDGDGKFVVETSKGQRLSAPAVFIAAGAGSFTPRRPKLEGLANFEPTGSVQYAVRNRADFVGKHLVIAGGGDSAIDWTLDLLPDVASLTLVHRRDKFRAHEASVQQMRSAVAAGKMRFVQGDLGGLSGSDGMLETVTIKTRDGEETVSAERLLAFFGLNIELGPIADWGLDLEAGRQIKVDTEKFQTTTPGIFAIGDINWYPGKLKLILSGFHEAALASQEAFRLARPNEKLRFQYTTSSSELQQRLKVA